MKRSRPETSRTARGFRSRWVVEPLEARLLMATAQVATTAVHKPVAESLYAPKVTFINPIYSITSEIPAASDPGGSGNVFQKNVFVDGYAVPYSTVWLAEKPTGYFINVALADYTGHYAFEITVPKGQTQLRLFAKNVLNQYSVINTLNVTRADPIVAWDSIALRAIRNQNLTAPEAARDLAILHIAQYNAIAPTKGVSSEAAANSAAETVLNSLFPSQATAFTLAMNGVVAGMPKSSQTTAGFTLGKQVAQAELDSRANDGSSLIGVNLGSNVPGLWRPTPPGYSSAQDASWGLVKPFALSSGSQFRPTAPPAVGSSTYDQALAEVTSLGRLTSTTRTTQQTAAAQFWADGASSFTNPGHWNEIAEQLVVSRKLTMTQSARLFVMLDMAMADAAIATSDAQATYDTWRPISAIQTTDPTWTPLVTPPATPSYVSDHAAYGAAAAGVLDSVFGSKTSFTDNLYASSGSARTFPSFAAAAQEDAQSQVWAGDAFAFDVTQGQTLGGQVGSLVVSQFPKAKGK